MSLDTARRQPRVATNARHVDCRQHATPRSPVDATLVLQEPCAPPYLQRLHSARCHCLRRYRPSAQNEVRRRRQSPARCRYPPPQIGAIPDAATCINHAVITSVQQQYKSRLPARRWHRPRTDVMARVSAKINTFRRQSILRHMFAPPLPCSRPLPLLPAPAATTMQRAYVYLMPTHLSRAGSQTVRLPQS